MTMASTAQQAGDASAAAAVGVDDVEVETAKTAVALASLAARFQKGTPKKETAVNIVKPGRRLLKEGVVCKKGTESILRRVNKRHVLLFTDAIILASGGKKDALHFKQELPLRTTMLRDLQYKNATDSSVPENSWELVTPTRGFVLYAGTQAEKQAWMTAFRTALLEDALGDNSGERCAPDGWQHYIVQGTLWSAAVRGDEEEMGELLKFAVADEGAKIGSCTSYKDLNVNEPYIDDENRYPLHYAVAGGHTKIVDMLILAGANTECQDADSKTPLHIAVEKGNLEIATALLDGDALVGVPDMWAKTPLLAVADCVRPEQAPKLAQLLLDRGADPDARDISDTSLLQMIASSDVDLSSLVVPLMLAGASPPHKTPSDETPLHLACKAGERVELFPESIKELLKTGVSPNARDTHGNTAAHQLASTLATAKAKNSAELVASATRCMQVLTAGGARLKVANNDGITVAKLLEDAGATAAIEAATQGEAQALTREAPAIAKTAPKPSHKVGANQEKDNASSTCRFCDAKFSLMNRRHHCRFCGKLACGACSTRRFPLLGAAKKETKTGCRVCDGCFNRLVTESSNIAGMSTLVFEQYKPKTKAKGKDDAAAAARAELLEGGGGAGGGAGAGAGGGTASAVADTQRIMGDNLDKANKRMVKLKAMEDDTKELADVASAFERATARLAADNKPGGWSLF